MRAKIQQRLQSLKSEFEAGQTMLAELEAKQANLRETLLRISGAIQVLQEIFNEMPDDNGGSPDSPDSKTGTIINDQPHTDIFSPNPSDPLTL